jgi:hypothetical protein
MSRESQIYAGEEESKTFFFEKKNQKTFISFGPRVVKTPTGIKVFFASFLFTKKKTLPPTKKSWMPACAGMTGGA